MKQSFSSYLYNRILFRVLCLTIITLIPAISGFARDTRVIIAGHTSAHWTYQDESHTYTLDPGGRLFVWESEQIIGAQVLLPVTKAAVADDGFEVLSNGQWHKLTIGSPEDVNITPISSNSQPPTTHRELIYPAPLGATGLSIDITNMRLQTTAGVLDLETMEYLDTDPTRKPQQLSSNAGIYQLAGHAISISTSEDATCISGESSTVYSEGRYQQRVLANRICGRALPLVFTHDDREQTPGILFIRSPQQQKTSHYHLVDDHHVHGDDGSYGTSAQVFRYSEDLRLVQRVRIKADLDGATTARGYCSDERCTLDVSGVRDSWSWSPDAEAGSRATDTTFALLRTPQLTVLAGEYWIEFLRKTTRLRVWLTTEGAASVCGWSTALSPRVLIAQEEQLYRASAIEPGFHCIEEFTEPPNSPVVRPSTH